MTARIAALLTLALALLAVSPLRADDEATAIVAGAWSRYRQVDTERETIDILVVAVPDVPRFSPSGAKALLRSGGRGVTHKRAVRHIAYGADGRDKIHILFSLPKAEAGTGLLVQRAPDASQDDQRLYLPALRSVRRVPASDTQTFVGTTLSYEDVRLLAGERTELFAYERRQPEDLDGRPCEVIMARPRQGTASAYGRRVVWLDREWRFPWKIEYYDFADRMAKVFYASDVSEVAPAAYRADLVEMRDLRAGQTTLLLTTERRVGMEIPAHIFSPEHLAHPD